MGPGKTFPLPLLDGLPYATIALLQRVLNAAVRLVYGLRPRDHVSAATIELHWLPVEARIQFKLCLLVHHTVIGNAPTYIADLLQPVSSLASRGTVLRSARFQERVLSSESGPSASQPLSRGTICRCMSAQPTTRITLSGD